MAKAKNEPTGWQPIEVGTNRNGYDPAPIEVAVTFTAEGDAKPSSATPTKEKS